MCVCTCICTCLPALDVRASAKPWDGNSTSFSEQQQCINKYLWWKISCCGELRARESNKDSRRKGRIERHTTVQFSMILFLFVLQFDLQYLEIWFKLSTLQKQRQRFVVWIQFEQGVINRFLFRNETCRSHTRMCWYLAEEHLHQLPVGKNRKISAVSERTCRLY